MMGAEPQGRESETPSQDASSPIWPRIMAALLVRLSPGAVDTWFRPVRFVARQDSRVFLAVPTEAFRSAFVDNYAAVLGEVVDEVVGQHLEIRLAVDGTVDPPAATQALPVAHVSELDSGKPTAPWLIERLWTAGGVGILAGQPKSLKTYVALEMAVSVASGSPCLGTFPVSAQGPALVYAAEDSPANLRERLASLAAQRSLSLQALDLRVITADLIRLDHPQDQERLRETVLLYRPALLVLDPLVRLHSQDENQSGPMAALLGYLRQLQRSTGVAILVVHHMRKQGSTAATGYNLRGSSDLYAWVDSYVCLQRRRDRISISAEHRTAAPLAPLTIELVHAPDNASAPGLRISGLDIEAGKPDHDVLRTRLVELLTHAARPLKTEEIRQKLQVRKQRVTEMLKDLCEQGSATRVADGYCAAVKQRNEGPGSPL